MPWRALPGERSDIYHVWLSEMMLQQTTVATVRSYFPKFIHSWPTIHDLAAASLDDILQMWAGLGYYARARNLHKCAVIVSKEFDGCFPETLQALQKLPGIGPYTAAAILAIGFDKPAAVMDTNVERILSRLFCIEEPLPTSRPQLRVLAEKITPKKRPGDFAQAMMDLGSLICTPNKPKCILCPISSTCGAYQQGKELPNRTPKKQKPTRYGNSFLIENSKGEILLRKRPEKGLLGGMIDFPSTEWKEKKSLERNIPSLRNIAISDIIKLPKHVRHSFTHFHLELEIYSASAETNGPLTKEYFWTKKNKVLSYALPTLTKKIIQHAKKYDKINVDL